MCPDTVIANRSCVNNINSSRLRGGFRNSRQQCVDFSRDFSTGKDHHTALPGGKSKVYP